MNTKPNSRKGSWIQLNERRAAPTGSLLLLLLLTLPAVVHAQFTYTTNNGAITITKYAGSGGAVTIPSMTNGLPVTSIGDRAFYHCTTLTGVAIPSSVTNIGNRVFSYCNSLTTIMVDALNPAYSSVAGVLFNKSQTTLVEYPGGLAGAYTIPYSVTSIGDSAFYYCTVLSSVTIPYSVTSIGHSAFYNCTRLTSAMIPNGVTSIGDGAFQYCYSLTSVSIANSVTSIGNYAFESCTSLTNVTIPNSVTNIGYEAFFSCSSLTAIMVDALNSVYSSVAGVLFNKSQTTLVMYPGGKAGAYTIPNSVTSIGYEAFTGCCLTSVTIPNSVTSIGDDAFRYCSGLTSVTIPNSVTNLGVEAFGSTGLISVTIGNGVTSITGLAFIYCGNLTSVTIPNSVTSIGDLAFYYCDALTRITIPNSVTNIWDTAFSECTSLTNVTIGTSVASIGDAAFSWCSNLTGVYFQGNAPGLSGENVFYADNHATVYYLPGTSGWGTTFGGLPTALWRQMPTIQTSPQTQTAEAGSAVGLWVDASSPFPLFYLWYLNATNLISCSTNRELELTNVQFAQSGAFTVVISNVLGAVTSAPVMLNVIASVGRRPVPGVKVTGETGSLLNVDYANSLSPTPIWTTLGSVSLISTSQYYFDLTLPLPPQRFYRAWQTGTPSVMPSLDLHLVPAITLAGNIGDSLRLDYINQFGPIDAWVTLATVPLTNTSQLYFDVSVPGQPQRLYRLVPLP